MFLRPFRKFVELPKANESHNAIKPQGLLIKTAKIDENRSYPLEIHDDQYVQFVEIVGRPLENCTEFNVIFKCDVENYVLFCISCNAHAFLKSGGAFCLEHRKTSFWVHATDAFRIALSMENQWLVGTSWLACFGDHNRYVSHAFLKSGGAFCLEHKGLFKFLARNVNSLYAPSEDTQAAVKSFMTHLEEDNGSPEISLLQDFIDFKNEGDFEIQPKSKKP
ncbi:hypothetical protein L596_025435 [Steinernema carpocapsae]|uniref:Uncharacterized protein n=1 Tax=Steinernema carpocapsae TaxID=34508 RepID=A0A4U5M7R8_STECR|nr:hypothetical protein L596_025435 [Steinernema carpocapsae]